MVTIDERIYLKVKIKSLAAEAKIIREQTKKAKRPSIKMGLSSHRRGVVRWEARHTLLAYGFLRGKAYRIIEDRAKEEPDWDKVKKMVEKYGSHWDIIGTYPSHKHPDDPCNLANSKKRSEENTTSFKEWIRVAKETFLNKEVTNESNG